MTRAGYLAFAAGATAVAGGWEALAVVEGERVAAALRRLAEPLRRAGREGREPTAPERIRLAALAAAVLLGCGWLAGGPLPGMLAALAGPVAAVAAVRARRRRHAAELHAAAPAVGRALADALGAGHSPRGALGVAATIVDGAAGRELAAAARALALGARTEDELEALRRRAASRSWDTLVAAVLLQRDAGGDLAALLRRLAASQEQAARLEADARTATAQARFTAWLVAAMPIAGALLAELAVPGFLAGLIEQPLSTAMAIAAAFLEALALLAVRRLARPPAL
jgi:tight adherence protein B